MKYLSVTIPCYNSAAYMSKCIESLLVAKEDLEILIVDDGSVKDNTLEIAKEYEKKYPDCVKAIHQENKGHGDAVNTGVANASGLYFKVVDSDDWVDKDSLLKVLEVIKKQYSSGSLCDMIVTNFIYDKTDENRKKVMSLKSVFPVEKVCGWKNTRKFKEWEYILMHSVIYKKDVLDKSGIKLPEHTFYVDNLFVYIPLPYVETIYYINTDLYHYYIGRADQSVNEKIMISRMDQQLRVNKLMIDYYTDPDKQELINKDKHLKDYMYRYLEVVTGVTSMMTVCSGSEEHYQSRKELYEYMEEKSPELFKKLKSGPYYKITHIPSETGRKVTIGLYHFANKIFNFN